MKKNYAKPSAFVENIEIDNILTGTSDGIPVTGNTGDGAVSERRGSFGNVWSE